MDKKSKQFFRSLVDFLSEVLGSNSEVVFHLRDKNGFYIESIKNGHISGRTTSSPITGLALEMIKNEAYTDTNYLVNYRGVSKKGDFLKSSTYFIKNSDGYLEGLICINTNVSDYIAVKHLLEELSSFRPIDEEPIAIEQAKEYSLKLNDNVMDEHQNKIDDKIEYFSHSIEEIIYNIIPEEKLRDKSLTPSDRKEIVSTLNDSGIFSMKGSVPIVADIMQVSIPTVYRYIKEVKNN